MSRDTPLLRISDLEAGYGRGSVLDAIDLDIAAGQIVGLIGETGSGKTTLCRAILGLTQVRHGTVEFEGADISSFGGWRLRKFRSSGVIQYVFQDPLAGLDPDWTIERSVVEPLVLGAPVPPGRTRRERAEQAFTEVGLDIGLLDRRPADLSGGQRQRAVIARALITQPRLLLCDEPVSALDAGNRILVLELFSALREQRGVSIVFVSHDIGSIAGTCDRLAVLHDGSLVEDGPAGDVIRSPASAYACQLIADVPSLP